MARKRNRGWFRKGHDPRRHVLTAEDRSRAGQSTWRKLMDEAPWMLAWLQRRIDATKRRPLSTHKEIRDVAHTV